MSGLHELLFGNWRNKGVALFFAITLWYVAFQSEKEECERVIRVELQSTDSKSTITEAQIDKGPGGLEGEFSGEVTLVFSGPRKQITRLRDLRDASLGTFEVRIPLEARSYKFKPEDFGYPRDGVDVRSIVPQSLLIKQEPLETVTIANVADKINVTDYLDGYEVVQREVIPSSLALKVSGPKSLIPKIGVSINVPLGPWRERYQGEVDVTLTAPEDVPQGLVERTVKAVPPRVAVLVVVRATQEAYPVSAIRVGFLIPPVKIPVKILLDEVVGDTIPVEFYGRRDEIAKLRDFLREQPTFSLGVRVPPFEREEGGQFTFTEDTLELTGFPGIQIRQHESRRKDKKTAWSYTIVPVKEAER